MASLLTTEALYSPLSRLTWRLRGTKSRRPLYFRLVPSVPYIEGIGSGFAPTLDTTGGAPNKGSNKKYGPKSLSEYLRTIDGFLPTLTTDAASRTNRYAQGGLPLSMSLGGCPNPPWADWYMGFPQGWTELAFTPSETP